MMFYTQLGAEEISPSGTSYLNRTGALYAELQHACEDGSDRTSCPPMTLLLAQLAMVVLFKMSVISIVRCFHLGTCLACMSI